MHCMQCAYPLWNLGARACPECGKDFRPTEFTFLPNAVRFLCPHCSQQYFGTDPSGHLVPSAFTCVKCGNATREDDMVLLPAEGVQEELANAVVMPWTQRETGLLRALWRTCMGALFRPRQLMRGLPPEADARTAMRFLVWLCVACAVVGGGVIVMFIAAIAVMTSAGVGAGPQLPTSLSTESLTAIGVGAVGFPAALFVGTLAWAAASHGTLRMLRAGRGGFDRTLECFAFASAAGAPLLGISPFFILCACAWPFMPFACVWMGMSSAIMMAERHQIPGWKAGLACFGPPAAICTAGVLTICVLIAISVWG